MSCPRPIAALALLLAPAAPCAGQELTGPPTARPGQLVYLDARGADSYAWGMTGPEPVEIRAFAQDDGSYAAPFASPLPGRYTVWVAATKDGQSHLLRHDLDVTGPGPQPVPPQPEPPQPVPPAPPPEPTPEPPPGPTPGPVDVVKGPLFATLFIEPGERDMVLQAMKTSPEIRAALPGLDMRWRVYHTDEAEAGPYLPTVAGKVPCVVFQSADGKVRDILEGPLPSVVVATAKRLRGQAP